MRGGGELKRGCGVDVPAVGVEAKRGVRQLTTTAVGGTEVVLVLCEKNPSASDPKCFGWGYGIASVMRFE